MSAINHSVSVTALTNDEIQWHEIYDIFSKVAQNLGLSVEHVSVYSSRLDDIEDEPTQEELIRRVYKLLEGTGISVLLTDRIVETLKKGGIGFTEL